MKFTNNSNLPEPFVFAFTQDEYQKGECDYSTTELDRPVRISSLTSRHFNEITEDVSDRVWAFMSQTKHLVLETIARSNPERYVAEQRYYAKMPASGRIVGGKIDLVDLLERVIYDWKEQSVWKFMVGDTKDWEKQGNINHYLLSVNGIVAKKIINVTWLRDWKKRKARFTQDEKYPKNAIHIVDLPIWSAGEQQNHIDSRIRQYEDNFEDPPVCTAEERWERPTQYAVLKKGTKRAIRVFNNKGQAYALLASKIRSSNPGEHFQLEERPQEPVRCLDFCPVAEFCDFGVRAKEKWEHPSIIED